MLGVLTHDAPGRPPLRPLLEALDVQGWTGPRLVLSDGALAADVPFGWRVVETEKSHPDNGAAYRRLLELADGDGQGALVLEDDVIPAAGALELVRRLQVPDEVAFVSFFECWFRREAPHALVRLPASAWVYAQAVGFPARTVKWLAAADWDLGIGADVNIATILRGSDCAVHLPALFQHAGRTSTAHPQRGDMPFSCTFLGAEYDARQIHVKGARYGN